MDPDEGQLRELAVRYTEAWCSGDPACVAAHYALGRALEKQGKAHEANGHYKLAHSLRPESEDYASRIRELD